MKKGRKQMRISLLACAATLCISGISASATEVPYPSFENRLMKGQTIVIEGEDLIYGPDMEVINDSLSGTGDMHKVSGGKALAFTAEPESYVEGEEQNPSFMVNFYAEDTSDYKIYLRIRPKDSENFKKYGLLMYNVNDEGWKFRWPMYMTYGDEKAPAYTWKTLVPNGQLAKSGNVNIKFKYINAYGDYTSVPFIIDKIMISSQGTTNSNNPNTSQKLNPTLPEEGYFNEYTSNKKKISLKNVPVFPDVQQHPRVLITKEEIPALKEKLKNPTFASKYESIKAMSERPINGLLPSSNTEYRNNSGIISTLQARAFMYLIGEADAAHADKTIQELKNYLATVTFALENQTYMSRYAGDVTVTAACVYDWCYDRLTDVDKEFIRRRCYEWQKASEVGYPPVQRDLITGHGTEEQITYHQMMAAIAFYDEDPDWYRLVAGTIFENMMPARNYFVSSGYSASFGAYFSARETGFVMLDKMIKTLDDTQEIYHEKFPEVFNVLLYRSLPNGIWMKDGDDFIWSRYKADTKSADSNMLMAYIGSEYNNPYLLRQGLLSYAWNSNNFSVTDLFMIDPSKDTKELDELPTTWKTTYPMTMMMARTGWQNGLNSDTAVAFMNGRELNIVDHQHRDAGTFQLYYKGMLAIDSGLYSEWGDYHYRNYTSHTIAHNGMLIYDPEYETKYKTYFTEQTGKSLPSYVTSKFSKEDNDGGQRPFDSCSTYTDLINDSRKVDSDYAATTLGTYIGPNSKTPAFSYLSTDLSLAYDYRTNGYRRSMVFMDLFNDDYPAAMIVYDRVNATDSTYKKTWLLHSEQEPTIDGNVTTITRTDNGQNGKLVNYTLLPQADNASISKVGGTGNEFKVNTTNYMYDEAAQNVFAFQHDSGHWRIELSPKAQANDDLFLNAMYVTDADGNLPQLPIIKEETDTYVGAVVRDRMVTFAKSFEPIKESFELTIPENGYDTVSCLMTDMEKGKWQISGGDVSICVESKEGEKCLYFTAKPGTYTVAPADANATVTEFAAPEVTKKTYGDFQIRKNNNLMYLPKPTKMVDGLPYVAVDGIMTQLGATVTEKTDSTVTVTMPSSKVVVLNKDSNKYTLNGKDKTLAHSVCWIDGEPYVYLADFTGSDFLNLSKCSYNSTSRLLTVTPR